MKVTLEQHGGHLAGMRRPALVVRTDTLPPDAAGELTGLVAAAKAAAPAPAQGRAGPAPDAMSYTITVENGGQPVLLRQSDTDMSQAFAALLDWIRRHARAG